MSSCAGTSDQAKDRNPVVHGRGDHRSIPSRHKKPFDPKAVGVTQGTTQDGQRKHEASMPHQDRFKRRFPTKHVQPARILQIGSGSSRSKPSVLGTRNASNPLSPEASHHDSDKLGPEASMLRQPETRPISHDQLVVEVKGIYAGLVMVEAKLNPSEQAQERQPESTVFSDSSRSKRLVPGILSIDELDEPEGDTSMLRQLPETRPISHDQLVVEVKGIYAGLVMVEAKCIEVDERQKLWAQNREHNPRKSMTLDDQWRSLIALHKQLLHEHHDFFLGSQHPSASSSFHQSRLSVRRHFPPPDNEASHDVLVASLRDSSNLPDMPFEIGEGPPAINPAASFVASSTLDEVATDDHSNCHGDQSWTHAVLASIDIILAFIYSCCSVGDGQGPMRRLCQRLVLGANLLQVTMAMPADATRPKPSSIFSESFYLGLLYILYAGLFIGAAQCVSRLKKDPMTTHGVAMGVESLGWWVIANDDATSKSLRFTVLMLWTISTWQYFNAASSQLQIPKWASLASIVSATIFDIFVVRAMTPNNLAVSQNDVLTLSLPSVSLALGVIVTMIPIIRGMREHQAMNRPLPLSTAGAPNNNTTAVT